METFSALLCLFSMLAGTYFLIALVFRKIRKKPKNKLYSRGFLVSISVFIASIVLFGVFQTPESREEHRQQRLEREQEKKEKAEQEAKEKAEQEAKEKAEQEAKEKAEQEAKEKAEQEAKEKAEQEAKEQTKQEQEEQQDTSKNEENSVKAEDIELNYLKQVTIQERPVMNGLGTERIGTYGVIKAVKEYVLEVTEEEYIEFCNDCVRNSGYNWFTIDFEDGTGIFFASSIPETGTYGTISETHCIVDVINYIGINSDKTITLSKPSTY